LSDSNIRVNPSAATLTTNFTRWSGENLTSPSLQRLWLDSVAAIGVALNISWEGAHLMLRSSQGLMDEPVEPDVLRQIQKAPEAFDHVITRGSGQRRFVDLHMHMPSNWTLGRAGAVRTDVEQSLMQAVPGLQARLFMLPSDVEAPLNDLKDTY
jgi:divalent metal cation (Fe/Co/Zn/Cd) transporter